MIQHVKVNHDTHDAIVQASRDAGIGYNAYLASIVADWATAYRRYHRALDESEAAPKDSIGVIPGGD